MVYVLACILWPARRPCFEINIYATASGGGLDCGVTGLFCGGIWTQAILMKMRTPGRSINELFLGILLRAKF